MSALSPAAAGVALLAHIAIRSLRLCQRGDLTDSMPSTSGIKNRDVLGLQGHCVR